MCFLCIWQVFLCVADDVYDGTVNPLLVYFDFAVTIAGLNFICVVRILYCKVIGFISLIICLASCFKCQISHVFSVIW